MWWTGTGTVGKYSSSIVAPNCFFISFLSNSGLAACLCTNELYQINKALTKFNEALTKPYHGLIEVLL